MQIMLNGGETIKLVGTDYEKMLHVQFLSGIKIRGGTIKFAGKIMRGASCESFLLGTFK